MTVPAPSPDASAKARPRLFYGWWIVAVAFVVSAFGWSTRASFAVIYVAMLDDLGWSRAQAVFGYGLSWLLLGVFAPLSGWLYDRLGPRVVVPAGGVSLALGLILTSWVQEPWQYYLSFGPLVGFGIAATLSVSNALISRWFVRRRGSALGIVTAGTSLGTLISLPLVAQVIAVTGWREALVWYGIALLIALIPLPALLYRRSPQSIGQVPDGQVEAAPAGRVRITSERAWTVREAVRTSTFWGTFVMLLLGVVAYQVLTTHQVAHAADRGIDPITAAFIFGLAGVYQFGGNLLGGWLSDRIGRQAVFLGGSLLGLAGIAALATVSGPEDLWKLHVFALTVGIGFGARISLLSAIPADAFGGPSFGLILGLLQAGSGLGGFIGPILGGLVYDLTASYAIAFATAAAAVLLSGVAAWFARPPRQAPATSMESSQVVDPAAWLAARHAEEVHLARALTAWGQSTRDAELAACLEIAVARARERAFLLRRAGAPPSDANSEFPDVSEVSAQAETDPAIFDRLRPLLTRYAALTSEPPGLPPGLVARFQTSEREMVDLLAEHVGAASTAQARPLVTLLTSHRLAGIESPRAYQEILCSGDATRPAVIRVWQAPGSRLKWLPAGSSYLLFGMVGCGSVTDGGECGRLEPGCCLEIGGARSVDITAEADLLLRYLLVTAGTPPALELSADPAGQNAHATPADARFGTYPGRR